MLFIVFCIRYSFQEWNVSFGNTSSSIYYCQTRQYTAEIFWQNSEYIVIKIFFPIKLMTHETLSITTWQIYMCMLYYEDIIENDRHIDLHFWRYFLVGIHFTYNTTQCICYSLKEPQKIICWIYSFMLLELQRNDCILCVVFAITIINKCCLSYENLFTGTTKLWEFCTCSAGKCY